MVLGHYSTVSKKQQTKVEARCCHLRICNCAIDVKCKASNVARKMTIIAFPATRRAIDCQHMGVEMQ